MKNPQHDTGQIVSKYIQEIKEIRAGFHHIKSNRIYRWMRNDKFQEILTVMFVALENGMDIDLLLNEIKSIGNNGQSE